MLLGGKGCQNCGCVPCNDCAQTCVNPHTGNAFATVYHYYVLGSEAGNTSDTYLTASGDVDTSDPYDGMDGTGPWYQEISGGFNFYPGATRFPCVLRFSFWRNNFPLGPTTVPPPSGTLTANVITVTCQTGAVRVGDHIVNAGETYTTNATVPLVSGAGDQSGADPRSYDGTVSVSPVCDTAGFSIKARIDWNTKKRQHILYGTVRECYEATNPCSCTSPDTVNNVLYVEVTGFTDPYGLGIPTSQVNGTYVADRATGFCDMWFSDFGNVLAIGSSGRIAIGTSAQYSTSVGTGPLRVYVFGGGGIAMSNTGKSYLCGDGDMGTLTTDVTLWRQSDLSDIAAGTVSIRVFS